MKSELLNKIRIAGILAIVGGIINIVSDQFLYNGPVSGKEMTLVFMAENIPYERILTGTILGAALGIPMWLFILIPLYYAMKKAGNWFTYPVLILFGHLVFLSALFHGSAALFSACHFISANSGADFTALTSQMMDKVKAFEQVMFILYPISMGVSSLLLIIAILRKKTLFKRWMALFTPIITIPLIVMISNRIPAPVGGYFAPMDGSLMFTVFFILTTVVTWDYEIQDVETPG